MNQTPKMTFDIIEDSFPILKKNQKEYEKHCVTYLLHNHKDIYIGETSNLKSRLRDHEKSKFEYKFLSTRIIISPFFSKSSIYDIESRLINYVHADGKYKVINIKKDQSSHFYYLKEQINNELFEAIWATLRDKKIVSKTLKDIETSYLFRYSPFKELSENQFDVVKNTIELVTEETNFQDIARDGSITQVRRFKNGKRVLIEGGPGTGKTLLIVKIIDDLLALHRIDKKSRIAVCIPQKSLLKTFKRVFKESGLKISLIRPIDLSKVDNKHYDLLIVDEAHRLKRHFSKQAKDLKHLLEGKITELDLAVNKSKNLILMHDPNQTVRPADIPADEIQNVPNLEFLYLTQQFRVKEGKDYLKFILALLQVTDGRPDPRDLGNYDFQIIDDIIKLQNKIKKLDEKYKLARMASGYFKEWISKKDKNFDDFIDDGLKAKWNSTDVSWVHTPNAINEVGCIHTLQGEDLNYCGVIIGDEIYLDPEDNKIKIRKEHYKDKNGTPVNGTDENNDFLMNKIKNIYYVLLTRGIHGTYVYIKDDNLKKYFKENIRKQ